VNTSAATIVLNVDNLGRKKNKKTESVKVCVTVQEASTLSASHKIVMMCKFVWHFNKAALSLIVLSHLFISEYSWQCDVLQEDTISINHNWLNAANIDICWDFVKDSLVSVEQEIAEHRATLGNWVGHCQVWQYYYDYLFCLTSQSFEVTVNHVIFCMCEIFSSMITSQN